MIGNPLHPAGRSGQEVLRGGLHQVAPGGHRDRQQADQAHVVVQRQPRDEGLVVDQAARLAAGVEVGADRPVGQHHALGLGGRSGGELQHRQGVGVLRGSDPVCGIDLGRLGDQLLQHSEGRVVVGAFDKGGELVVDQHQGAVGGGDAAAGLVDERFDRSEAHRQGQHHQASTGQPGGLDGGDQGPGGGPQDGHVGSGRHTTCLQHRRQRAGGGVGLPQVVVSYPSGVARVSVAPLRAARSILPIRVCTPMRPDRAATGYTGRAAGPAAAPLDAAGGNTANVEPSPTGL